MIQDCYYELINARHGCLLRIINCEAQVVVLYVWLSWFSRNLRILMFFKLLNSFGQFQLNWCRVPSGISTHLILPAPHPLLPKLDHFLEMSNVQFHCIQETFATVETLKCSLQVCVSSSCAQLKVTNDFSQWYDMEWNNM